MKKTKTIRDSRFELLRIFAMILIIMHHFACHGGWVIQDGTSAINQAILDFFVIGGKIGVNVFVLISGYFLVTSKFKWQKILKLIVQLSFYTIIIYLILVSCGQITFTLPAFIKTIFPIIFFENWFMTYYAILFCLSPFLNILIKKMDSKQYLLLIIFLIVLQTILPYILGNEHLAKAFCFITLYLIAGYIKLYPNKFFDSFKLNISIFIVTFLGIAILYIFANYNAWNMTHLLCILCSISMFLTFKNMKEFRSNTLNLVSSTTLGIYLIHDNKYFSSILWQDILNCPAHLSFAPLQFITFAICSVIVVFVVCALIELLRQEIFNGIEKIYLKIKTSKKINANENQ